MATEAHNPMNKLLTFEQAAEYLNVPVETLKYWKRIGVGPAWVKLEGKSVRYNRTDLDDYIRACTHRPSVRAALEEANVRV